MTAARSTLAVGCTTITNASSATPASSTAARRPTSRADSSTAPHTMVTLAPETAVRCVMPAARNSRPVSAVTADVSPRTSAGSIAAWSPGSTSRAVVANRARTACAARCTGPARPVVGRPDALSTATVRSWRPGRPMRAENRSGCPTMTSKSEARAKTVTRPDVRSSRSRRRVARNISRSRPNGSALSLGVTVTGATVPNAATIGWRATASARSAIANPKPAPTTPMAASPAPTARRRDVRHDTSPAAPSSATPHQASTHPTGHTMPAAVTIHPVSAAGTRRTSM